MNVYVTRKKEEQTDSFGDTYVVWTISLKCDLLFITHTSTNGEPSGDVVEDVTKRLFLKALSEQPELRVNNRTIQNITFVPGKIPFTSTLKRKKVR